MNDNLHEPLATDTQVSNRRNWWKVAFFVLLIVAELLREIIVLGNEPSAFPNTAAMVINANGFVTAEGTWARTDGGGRLVPSAVRIECWQQDGSCAEFTTTIIDDSVFAPTVDRFEATFSDDAVTYENDRPDCARYAVRIDLQIERVFAVREKVENPTNPNCTLLEPRIESTLVDGLDTRADALDGDHFVPLVRLIAALF